jgi:spore maturation protein CgeB
MKVLIIQENGRHEENRHFRECFSIQRALIKLEHEADIWGLGHENYHKPIDYDSYDLILNLENYAQTAGNWLPDLSKVKTVKLLWSIDAHCLGTPVFEKEYNRGGYDFLLHSSQDHVQKEYHIWFPNSFDDTIIKPIEMKKQHDFGFCGNYANRKQLLEWLEAKYGLHLDIFVIGENMVKAVNSYRCHFNMNMAWNQLSGLNYRNYETIGCGTLLLTSHSTEYDELGFKDGENCFLYKSIPDLEEKIDFINKNDISNVAKAGLKLSKSHTYEVRMEKLLKDIKI